MMNSLRLRVAIVGSRGFIASPLQVKWLEAKIPSDAIVVSGNAVGADQLSKLWKNNIQYLPWSGYNKELGYGAKCAVAGHITIYDNVIGDLFPWITKASVMKLVRRNCALIGGLYGNKKVDILFYGCPKGVITSGTKYALTFAKHLGIPIFKIPDIMI